MNQPSTKPFKAIDLEQWRVKCGFTISAACELLGLQRAKWTKLMQDPQQPLTDMTLCILLTMYEHDESTLPIQRIVNAREQMISLGYDPDKPADKKRFAGANGRENAATYRWDRGQGGLSKPVERLFEATNRLPASKRRQILEGIAKEVAERQGIRDPLSRGSWRKDD